MIEPESHPDQSSGPDADIEATASEPNEAPATDANAADEEPNPLKESVVTILRTVYDPEIPVDIFELGMIYDVAVADEGQVDVKMTLTSPACPVAGTLPGEVEAKVAAVDGVNQAKVELVWEPPWTPDMMSDAAKLKLNMM